MLLDGKNIVSVRTLKSMYDQDSVEVRDDKGNFYRLKADVICAMLNEFIFDTITKTKHTYLEIDWDGTDEMRETLNG
jgi:hypothetical protein